MESKQIKINPNFFKVNSNKGGSKRKPKPIMPSVNSTDVKKKLIDKIKKHHSRQTIPVVDNKLAILNEDFDTQLGNLEKIIQKRNDAKNKKETKKRRRRAKKEANAMPVVPFMPINTTVPTVPLVPINTTVPVVPINTTVPIAPSGEPVYGCLKNGNKPTWSQYNKTLKKTGESTNKIQFIDPPIISAKVLNADEINERQTNLNLLKTRIATPKKQHIPPKLKKYKRTLKKYKLGKNTKNLTVGVLIKSGKTRKIVKDETLILKSRCLTEVKQYLRKHNLICAGTNAPENVIRKIYEDSFLAGKIFNKNPTTLLHNYMSETD